MIFYAKNEYGFIKWNNNKEIFEFLMADSDYKGSYIVTIEKETGKRTLDQNSYLFGVVYKTISDYTGNSVVEVHEIMKRLCLPPKFIKYKDKEIKVAGSTTGLNKLEMGEYILRIMSEVASLGIIIPEAEKPKADIDYDSLERPAGEITAF